MAGDRRNFLGRLAAGAAAAAGVVGLEPHRLDAETTIRPVSDKWDMSWAGRINGKFRAVFDSPKIEEGGELWRAATWRTQIIDVYGVKDADVNPVLVIRHGGIPLVMNDAFWARHKIGKKRKIKDPVTGKTADTNPIGDFKDRKDIPAWMTEASIARFTERGGVVLGCNFLRDDGAAGNGCRQGACRRQGARQGARQGGAGTRPDLSAAGRHPAAIRLLRPAGSAASRLPALHRGRIARPWTSSGPRSRSSSH